MKYSYLPSYPYLKGVSAVIYVMVLLYFISRFLSIQKV